MKIKATILISSIIFCGCSTFNDFSKRKYFPGNFLSSHESLKASEKEEVNLLVQDDEKKLFKEKSILSCEVKPNNSFENISITEKSNDIYVDVTFHPKHKLKSTVPRSDNNTYYKSPDDKLDKYADKAELYGILSIISYFILGLPAIVFAILSIVNANKVLYNPKSNDNQIKRAKKGKKIATITLTIFIISVFLLLLLLGIIPLPPGI